MAISPMPKSEPCPPVSSKYKSQKKTWDAKTKLVKLRLQSLINNLKNDESQNMDKPIVCYKAKVDRHSGPHDCVSVPTSAVDRAEEVQKNLSLKFPNFLKPMLRSHVSGGFWLGLPKKFCDEHLPKHDETIVLVDENEQGYDIKYLANKIGLSGGWRGFSLAHKLMEGDVLVFQLIEPCKFKIYIVRASRFTEVDGAIGLLNLDFHNKPTDAVKTEDQSGKGESNSESKKQKYQDLLIVDSKKDKNTEVLISDNELAVNQCIDDIYNSGSESVEGIRFSDSVVYFKDVKDFKDFTICVDSLILDSELAMHLREKYYELCRSQNIFLHEKLIYGLNIKLVTGIISETVNIADAIRAIRSTSSLNDLESYDRTLKAFEDLGMAVGFLRDRIRAIIAIPREYQDIIESKRSEKAQAEAEMRCIKEKLIEVHASIKSINKEIDTLTVKSSKGQGFEIRDVASAPW